MAKFILAIDEGTTGTKALIMDEKLKSHGSCTINFKQYYPKPGWVEHDVDEIWAATLKAIRVAGQGKYLKKIAAIGITNQRETVCFWDKKTGKSLTRALVWQDRRTSPQCDELRAKGLEPEIQRKTGLLFDPYFSGTKVAWVLNHVPAVQKAAQNGTLAIGTIDSFLIHKLTGGKSHVTEPSNGSRTLAFHLTERRFDPGLCEMLGIPLNIWPEVKPSFSKSNDSFGVTLGVSGIPDGTPITGVLGDQQAALLGQACIDEGSSKCTYGTGAFLLMNTGKKPVFSRHRLLSTIAWQEANGETTYALEGSAFIAGAAVQWVRDGLGFIKESKEIEKLAEKAKDSGGVTFVPALTGLGAPYWDPAATGLFTGLTRGTERAHIARATLEGIAFQNVDLLSAMEKDLGKKMTGLNVDGGACRNNLLMQIQANFLGVELKRPKLTETTSLGAVFAAGLGAGIWSTLSQVRQAWRIDRSFKPKIDEFARQNELKRWALAVKKALTN